MMALQFTLNSLCPQLPLGSQPENQQSLFVEHTSIGWSHGAATAIEKTSLSRLMKSSYPLPGGGAGNPAPSTHQAYVARLLIELYPEKPLAHVGVHRPSVVETMCANHTCGAWHRAQSDGLAGRRKSWHGSRTRQSNGYVSDVAVDLSISDY